MNKEKISQLLSKDIVELDDISTLRDLRQFFDDRVQELKVKKANDDIEKYRPTYENKFILSYGCEWNGPITVRNENNIYISKIKKIDFIGNGFIRCKATVLHICYAEPHARLHTGLTAKDYGEVSIKTWNDNQYSINLDKTLKFLTAEEVKKYIDEAKELQTEQIDWFTKETEISN